MNRVILVLLIAGFVLVAGCSDELISEEQPDNSSVLSIEDVQQTETYDFSTPEEYVREYVRLYEERFANYSSDSCTEVPGNFSEGFKSELQSTLTMVRDPTLSDEERIGYAEDLNSLREAICAPDVLGGNFTLIIEELISQFPHLSELDYEEWKVFLDNALVEVAAKTTTCEEIC